MFYGLILLIKLSSSSIWSVTEVVSTVSTNGASDPSIVVDSEDNVHVLWSDSTDYSGSGTGPSLFYKLKNVRSSPSNIRPVQSNNT
ncbi:unnamed protein product [marine sediment metagenome]|uniref:Fibronectin type-III domain-containing protein n=1 Tax=marine sediment metagenome TaxID=412755 RepID=X1CRC4_9ZZZZ